MVARTVLCLALLAFAGFTAAGCGGQDSADERVGADVEGSGQDQLLRDDRFRRAVADIGVLSPRAAESPGRFGRRIGAELEALKIDLGRIEPGDFAPGRYRDELRRRGRLSASRFEAAHGAGPLEQCDRMGILVGQLDMRLDEGADPPPELATGVLAGLRGGEPAERGAAITAVRDDLNGRLPASEALPCLTKFQSSYTFAVGLYRGD